ncbi:hypothetical protein [Actinocorallia libanotica]|uniref:Conjugal transfer protein TraI n=1 Tax=Actinocorallia libanotica TaxID=46162 RepID=A0ABN1RZW9_9ACTN
MNTTAPTPDPPPEDIQHGLAQIERYVAAQAPDADDVGVESTEQPDDGETRRVRALRAQVAEARRLAELQNDDTPLLVDTPKVRKRRMKAAEAKRLYQLSQDPMMRAWQDAQVRRIVVTAFMVALVLALGWSTAGVQEFASEDAADYSPKWWFAWVVEPFVSLPLLGTVGARAYLAAQGRPLKSTVLNWVEALFLLLSLGMNAWPYTPLVAEEFVFSTLTLHIMGPIVAAAVVMVLPIILKGFSTPAPQQGATDTPTTPTYRQNAPAPPEISSPSTRVDAQELIAKARRLIASGRLSTEPSATALRKELGCSTDSARAVRDALRGGSA